MIHKMTLKKHIKTQNHNHFRHNLNYCRKPAVHYLNDFSLYLLTKTSLLGLTFASMLRIFLYQAHTLTRSTMHSI